MPCNKISHEHRHRDRLVVCHDCFWPEICVPCIHKCDNGCCRIAEVRNIYKASSPRQLQKNPGSLTAPGQSYAWTLCTCWYYFVYSITEATRPDPTVRPPSRYQNSVLQGLNGYFSCVLYEKTQIFRRIRVIFEDFVIMVLSPRLNKTKYLLFHNF